MKKDKQVGIIKRIIIEILNQIEWSMTDFVSISFKFGIIVVPLTLIAISILKIITIFDATINNSLIINIGLIACASYVGFVSFAFIVGISAALLNPDKD